MRDIVKKSFLLGLGAASIAKKKAEKKVMELVRKRAISKKDGLQMLNKIKKHAANESIRIARFAEQEANRIAMQLGAASKSKARKAKKMLRTVDRQLTAEGKRTLRRIIKELE
ncbi:hypothetical protein HYU09_01735 [Candidatus Woesearchaeota archaeon]|nr:hypothetical protein [Candidatus Woesearchaeota archaeon]